MEPHDQTPAKGPPTDPEDWTDARWIEWLKETDVDPEGVTHPVTALGRITHSSGGSVLGQAMLGMANALYGRNDNEVVIVVEDGSQPDEDKSFAIHLDPEHPERSAVVFRSLGQNRSTGKNQKS